MIRVTNVTKTSSGAWAVIVEKDNYSQTTGQRTSITRWTYRTTDSMTIDEFYSDD